ncbi:MAG: LCP family protein [Clostridiales bacterium]|nr:LCP family protein [Clostridiales bacterium]
MKDNFKKKNIKKTEEKKSGKKKLGLYIFLGIVGLIVLLIAIYFIFFVKPPTTPSKTYSGNSTSGTLIKTDKKDKKGKEEETTEEKKEEKTEDKPNGLIDENTDENIVLEMAEEISVENENQKDGFFTVLVVGTDKSGKLTDTIVVATFDTNTKSAALLNVPRDTASKTANGFHKINAAYMAGGIDRTIREIKNLLGYEVNRYIIVDFDAFENLIDAIDGVEIDVPHRLYYRDPDQDLLIDIKAGLQTLDGEDALKYMRFRKGYADADLGRIEAQQVFYKAVVKKLATPSTLLKLPNLVNVMLENVETDLTLGEMIWIGTKYVTMNMDDLHTDTLPNIPRYVNDVSYVFPIKNKILKLINDKYNPYENDITNVNQVALPSSGSSSSGKTTKPVVTTNKNEDEDITKPSEWLGDDKTDEETDIPPNENEVENPSDGNDGETPGGNSGSDSSGGETNEGDGGTEGGSGTIDVEE